VDSSLVSYDGRQNVRDEEHSIERKKPGRKTEPERRISLAEMDRLAWDDDPEIIGGSDVHLWPNPDVSKR
jgi:hypothetical protein